jgi:serine/threonine-protein kinase
VASNELAWGTLVGGFKIRQRIGEGPSGAVYAALDPRSGRKVAVKVLHPRLAPDGAEGLERLRADCALLAALRHPGVIAFQEVGQLGSGAVYLIAEFALGQPLTDLLAATGPLAPAEARPLLEALALILATAHGHHVVHGGLSPDNVWTTPRAGNAWPPMVRVMDFGLAALRQRAGEAQGGDALPYYLSPEQCRGEPAREPADLYALGVIAYQMLTGRVPFSSARPSEVVRLHLEEPPRPPSDLAPLSPAVDRLLLQALAKRPEDRFASALKLRLALGALDEAWPPPAARDEGYASYDLEDARAGHVSGEITPHGAPARAAPPTEVDAVIVEPAPSPPDMGASTAVLPMLERAPARGAPLGAALLGLALALVLGLVAYWLLAGSWPWSGPRADGAPGQLRVVSAPPGAKVLCDRVARGQTPLTLELRQGRPYQVTLLLDGHEPWEQTVALALGEEERLLRVALSEGPARYGTLKLHASVAADFFLDGRRVGTQTRELTLADVSAGRDHELRVVAPGHRPAQERLRVAAGSTRVVELVLEPLPVPPR